MLGKFSRTLQQETLEDRCLLSGTTSDILPPPPIDNNVALIDFDAPRRQISAGDGFHREVEVVRGNGFSASSVQGRPEVIQSGDFNGDGVTDFLSANDQDDWFLHLNDGTQLYELPLGAGLSNVRLLGTGDFDQDGKLDVVSLEESTGQLWVSLNRGDSFAHRAWGEFINPRGWSELYVGDYNGDNLPDVLGGETGGHWWLAQNNGGREFDNYRWGRFADYGWADVLEGEFTGDQYTDIVARAPDNTWWLWAGADTGFEASRYFGHWKMRNEWSDVSVADFNNDGREDVIGRSEDGFLWVGSATPTGFHSWTWGDGWVSGANWQQVTVVDMNGDDLPDQVGHAQDDTWWYALNSGTGFQNHFWQRRGAVDYVAPRFVRAEPVDLTAFLPENDDDGSEDSPTPTTDPGRPLFESGTVTIQDSRIVLRGSYEALAGIEIISRGGYLELEQAEIGAARGIDLKTPFPLSASVVVNTPNAIIIGVLGAVNRIDVNGNVETAILYSGPLDGAVADLTVSVGIGDSDPYSVAVELLATDVDTNGTVDSGGGSSGGDSSGGDQQSPDPVNPDATLANIGVNESKSFLIRDGRVVLNGPFSQLSGFQVVSRGGHLSLEANEIVPGLEIENKAPFNIKDGTIVENTSSRIVVGVLGADKRIAVAGQVDTGVIYKGSVADIAAGDLTVELGLGDSGPLAIPLGQ